ncbi:MAG: hypothetical protein PHF84_13085, partial [bacterium]|nr:hypothetical protein [bacterium]
MKINEIKAEKVLCGTGITLAGHVINPFRGCEFGCLYCYSRNNKNAVNRKEAWGEYLDVKVNAPEILEKELAGRDLRDRRVLIGSVTEAFQPVEKEYRLMKRILNLLKTRGMTVIILTRSGLILDYLDDLDYSEQNRIYFTYNSEEVRSCFEKETPAMKERLETMEMIMEKRIGLTVYISPFFPFLTGYKKILDELARLRHREFRVCFEGYNLKMGNWEEVRKRLPEDLLGRYSDIYRDRERYEGFWSEVKKDILGYSKGYGFYAERVEFESFPYDDY